MSLSVRTPLAPVPGGGSPLPGTHEGTTHRGQAPATRRRGA
ncbi:hypothetical protein [Streptomyces sp. NPDC090112]